MGFFDALMAGSKTARTGRAAERAALTVSWLLEARNESAMQVIGGSSADTPAPARAPRRTRAASRKPLSGDDDSDGEPAPRYILSATSHEGLVIHTPDGKPAGLRVVAEDGEILSGDVCGEAFKLAVAAYRQFLQGTGHLKVHASAPGISKA